MYNMICDADVEAAKAAELEAALAKRVDQKELVAQYHKRVAAKQAFLFMQPILATQATATRCLSTPACFPCALDASQPLLAFPLVPRAGVSVLE